MTSGLKPTWQNMKGGASAKTPVEEVVGQLVDWKLEATQFGGNNVTLKFTQCQILHSDTPYPYAEWDLVIKYSDSAASAWGIFGLSAAEKLGMDIEVLDIDLLKGRWLHLLRSPHDFGEDRNGEIDPLTGKKPRIAGLVWRIIALVIPGQPVTSVKPAAPVATPAQVAPVAAIPPVAAPVAVTPPLANGPAPVAVVQAAVIATAPVAEASVAVATAPVAANIAPEDQALLLLHGKDTSSFFQVAVPDPIIRADANLVNSILSNTFITSLIAGGKVTKNEDGTHSVVGM